MLSLKKRVFLLKESFMHPRLKGCLERAMCVELMTLKEVARLQEEKLKALLGYAAEKVPFYRAYFAAHGVDPARVGIKDFPIIDKQDIRNHEKDFIADDFAAGKLASTRTSGSTGEPFLFYRGKNEWDDSYACLWRGLFRLGIEMGDKRAFIKGVDERPNVSLATRMKRWCYGILNRCIVIDAHFLAISEANVLSAIRRLRRYRPAYLHGYVSSIDLLAATAERLGLRLDDIGLKVIVTESEKLHDFQRERISRLFGCRVVENYGCVEFGMIAQPDAEGNCCINDDHVYVETDEDGAAIYTNLDARAFPLIRFRNGDRIRLRKEKRSRLPYREMESVDGRVAETIRLPQGGELQGYIVMYPISKHMRYLREYQVYQPDINHLLIRVVEAEKLPVKVEKQILHEMHTIVGDRINLEIKKVESIPLTKRGKRTFVCSDVKEKDLA